MSVISGADVVPVAVQACSVLLACCYGTSGLAAGACTVGARYAGGLLAWKFQLFSVLFRYNVVLLTVYMLCRCCVVLRTLLHRYLCILMRLALSIRCYVASRLVVSNSNRCTGMLSCLNTSVPVVGTLVSALTAAAATQEGTLTAPRCYIDTRPRLRWQQTLYLQSLTTLQAAVCLHASPVPLHTMACLVDAIAHT